MRKTIVITGSTRGIGFGLAHEFLKQGCNVVVSSRTQAAVDKAASELAGLHSADRVRGQACDVTQLDQVQALWDNARSHFGTIEIWINNAGVAHPDVEFWKLLPHDVKTAVNINLIGLIHRGFGQRTGQHAR